MANQTPAAVSPLELVVPGYQVEQMAMDRQRALAAALQQASLTSPEGQMVSGHYIAPSPMQYIAKLGQGAIAKDWNSSLDQKAVENSIRANQAMAALLRGDQPAPAQAESTSIPNTPLGSGMAGMGGQLKDPAQEALKDPEYQKQVQEASAQGRTPISPVDWMISKRPADESLWGPMQGGLQTKSVTPQAFGLANLLKSNVIKAYGGDAAANAYWKQFEPTDLIKTLTAAGIDPNSQLGRQILQQNVAKTNYIPQESHRPGSFAVDPVTKKTTFFPQIPEGGMPLYDANGNPAGVTDLPGAGGVIGRVEAAKLRGKNSQTLAPPDMSPTLPNGQIVPRSIDDTLNGPQGLDTSKLTSQQIAALQKADPEAFTNGVARFNGVGPAYGQKEGAVNAQTELSKKFSDLTAANQQAQTTNSYLQSIKDLAAKAATGQQSDRINYVNGLLSVVGNERAKDAVTANDLLNKYSNQIVARLGQGGLGTDAARSILQSAYPNAHMTKDAIHEAADNLVAANQMVQAKARLLAPLANARNATNYNELEMKFDQNADPRIFQYASIQDPVQRQAFAKKIIKQDPKIGQKIKNLESLGAL